VNGLDNGLDAGLYGEKLSFSVNQIREFSSSQSL